MFLLQKTFSLFTFIANEYVFAKFIGVILLPLRELESEKINIHRYELQLLIQQPLFTFSGGF